MKNPAILLLCIGLASCAAKKAIIVEEPKIPDTIARSDKPKPPVDKPTALPDGGMRIGDGILALPEDRQLRSVADTPTDGDTKVIARPPRE